MNFVILFTSKNNYDLLDNWLNFCENIPLPKIINLDLGSNEFQLSKGEKICEENFIKFIIAERTEFQHNIQQIFTEFGDELKYILYLHQDCFPIQKNTFQKIDNYILKNDFSKFGLIGFNIYHDLEIKLLKKEGLKLMTTSRCVLQKGNGYYMRKPKGSRVNYKKFKKDSAFVVENIMWTALLINSKSFLDNIKIDLKLNFFLAPDDLAYQFLSKEIFNVVIPDIHFFHDQKIKTKYNLPKDSPIGKIKEVENLYGKFDGIQSYWKDKWKFHYNPNKQIAFFNNRFIKKLMLIFFPKIYASLDTIARYNFNKSESKKGYLVDFYNHDPIYGPMKYIDLKS